MTNIIPVRVGNLFSRAATIPPNLLEYSLAGRTPPSCATPAYTKPANRLSLRQMAMLVVCLAMLAWSAHAGVINVNANIPDGSAVGWSGTATASGYLPSISAVSVNLNISGGYNGDLYAYISYGGVLVPLLNRVGVTATGGGNSFGYGDAGFNVTLSSASANDVHFYQNYGPSFSGGQLTGTWQPDGRAIDPQSSPSAFDLASRVSFGSYNGMNPNGTWTLFIADMSAGGQSQLVSWELDITAVPEPVNVALSIFAGVFLAVTLVSRVRVRKLLMSF